MLREIKRVRKRRLGIYVVQLTTVLLTAAVIGGITSSNSFGEDREKPFMHLMHEAMASMDRGMESAPMTGDPDRDFAAMMIPHHQGAIDMAKAELLYGKDPVLRRLAQEILVTQEQEIEVMRTRLKQLRPQ